MTKSSIVDAINSVADTWVWPAVSGIAMFATFSVIATIDHSSYNRALWSAVDRLRARGVPVAEIDAATPSTPGFSNVRPEVAHREADGRITIAFSTRCRR